MATQPEVKTETIGFINFIKAYSPAIDFAISAATSIGIPIAFSSNIPLSLGVMMASIPFDHAKNYFYEESEVFKTGFLSHNYLKAFIDNISGAAIITATYEGFSKTQSDNSTHSAVKKSFGNSIVEQAKMSSVVFGGQGVGQIVTESQLLNPEKIFSQSTSEKYEFNNSLTIFKFGIYFFSKTILKGIIGDGVMGQAVSGSIAGAISNTCKKSVSYLINGEGFENYGDGLLRDGLTVFVNSALYGVHEKIIGYHGFVKDTLIDANIEALDVVLKKDIIGYNPDDAIFTSLYDAAHTPIAENVKMWVYDQCMWASDKVSELVSSGEKSLDKCFDGI